MRNLTNTELAIIHGGISTNQGYDFTHIVTNTVTGCVVGVFFPGVSAALGVTSVIANPILATGALFGGYAAAMMGANALDNLFRTSPSIEVSVAAA